MADTLAFDRAFDAPAGLSVSVSPLVRRIVANNGGPFTFTGTCTYLVGHGDLAVIDPGPEDPAHLAAILDAAGTGAVSAILVTHTHRDHSPGARQLARATGAPIVGCGPHRPFRPLADAEATRLDASGDRDHLPDRELSEGDTVRGPGWTLRAVATPGHTANHLAFALEEEQALFSGDHVMGWSTSIVAPPDGAMADYMASLQVLAARDDRVYWPGHGGPVADPQRRVRGLLTHRRQRETAILERLAAGDGRISDIVPKLYPDIAPSLRGAAALSVYAHLEDLVARGLAKADGAPALDSLYRRL